MQEADHPRGAVLPVRTADARVFVGPPAAGVRLGTDLVVVVVVTAAARCDHVDREAARRLPRRHGPHAADYAVEGSTHELDVDVGHRESQGAVREVPEWSPDSHNSWGIASGPPTRRRWATTSRCTASSSARACRHR